MNLNLENSLVTKWAQAAANSPSGTGNKSNKHRKNAEGTLGLFINTDTLKLQKCSPEILGQFLLSQTMMSTVTGKGDVKKLSIEESIWS